MSGSNMGVGNMGMGNMGIGNAGGGGGLGGGYFADRVDLPFVTEPGTDSSLVPVCRYRDNIWSASFYSWLVLTDFVTALNGDMSTLDQVMEDKSPVKASSSASGCYDWSAMYKDKQNEIDILKAAARDERADAMAEILGQRDEFLSYFQDLLSASTGFANTTRVLASASMLASYFAMYYKGKYRRPRPSMLYPALMPPIEIPGHASFPSGHSTQAHLMALCMDHVLEGYAGADALHTELKILADRIARNREIAGVHYPSDSAAGVALAQTIFSLLPDPDDSANGGCDASTSSCDDQRSWYVKAVCAAREEWR